MTGASLPGLAWVTAKPNGAVTGADPRVLHSGLPYRGCTSSGAHTAGVLGVALLWKVPAMSRTISVFVRVDRSTHTVTMTVTGDPTPCDRRVLHRMTARDRTHFPDAAVTVDIGSTRTPKREDLQGENIDHRDDGQPETSSTPAAPDLVTASSSL